MRRTVMAGPETKRFTREEYHRMVEAGILREGDRTELIDGRVVLMAPIGPRHSSVVGRITDAFGVLRESALLWVQNPIAIGRYNEPIPDFALLRRAEDFYSSRHPEPEDVLLALEVAHTTRSFDRGVKHPLYSRAGIAEFWLVDLVDDVIEVCREPGPDGYESVRTLRRGDTLRPSAFPDFEVAAESILGPA